MITMWIQIDRQPNKQADRHAKLDRIFPRQKNAIDHYSSTIDHYSLACVNSFQTNPRQSKQIQTDVHKSLLFTSMHKKKFDRFPNRLLLIRCNILQVSTDRLASG